MTNQEISTAVVLLLLAAGIGFWVRYAVRRRKHNQPLLAHESRADIQWSPFVLIVAGGWLLLMLFSSLASKITRFTESGSAPPQLSLETVQSNCLIGIATLAVFLLLLSESGRRPLAEFGITLQNWKTRCLTGVTGFIATFPLVTGIAFVIWLIQGDEKPKHSYLLLIEQNGTFEVVAWIALAVLILAPLTEELLFRVILQGAARTRFNAFQSIILSSLVFVLVHGFPDMLALLPLAVGFGYVYERTHSYLTVVVMHATFNAVNLGLALLS